MKNCFELNVEKLSLVESSWAKPNQTKQMNTDNDDDERNLREWEEDTQLNMLKAR